MQFVNVTFWGKGYHTHIKQEFLYIWFNQVILLPTLTFHSVLGTYAQLQLGAF